MTHLMEQAVERLQALSPTQQDEVARFLLNELQEDERWSASTTAHATKLEGFISKVLADDAQGLCDPLDPDHL